METMKLIQQILAAIVMTAVISTGAFAQGKGGDKRPKKEPVRVIDGKGGNRPPPQQPKPPPKQDDRRGKKRP